MQTTAERCPTLRRSAEDFCVSSGPDRLDALIALALFTFTVVYLSAFLRYSALEADEGILLQGAQRILEGQLPYRDFFSFYTPGSFYFIAGLFRIFGDSFAVARFSIVLVGALFPVLTYTLARRMCSRAISVFVASLTIVAGVAYRFLVLHNWYSTLLVCLALYAALRALETRRPVWFFITGSLCSLTVLFEQSKGAGLCFGLLLGFMTLRLVQRKRVFRRSELSGLSAGFLCPFGLVGAYFGVKHNLATILNDWFWPLRHYGLANRVPYGYQNWSDHAREVIFRTGPAWAVAVKVLIVSSGFIVPVLPLVAIASYAYFTMHVWRGASVLKASQHILVSSTAIGLFLSVVVSRADVIHFMYLLPLWLVPLAWVLGLVGKSGSQVFANFRIGLFGIFALSFALLGLALLTTAAGARNTINTRRGRIRTPQIDSVIPYVNAHHSPGDPLLVYPYLPLYYYLTGTRSIARLDYFQPGMNTAEQARQIIVLLKAHPESSVLFEPSFLEKIGTSWPDTPIGAIAHDAVGDYLVENYQVCKLLRSASDGLFEYMVSRHRNCR